MYQSIVFIVAVMARVILHAGLGYLVATYAVYVRQQVHGVSLHNFLQRISKGL